MNIKLAVVGKIKEKYFQAAIQEYQKRMGRFCDFQIMQVPDQKAPENLSAAEKQQVMEQEGIRLLTKIKPRDYVIALVIKGKQYSSEELAATIKDLTTYGHSDLTFVIGGSLGLAPAVLQRADATLSFGAMTLPHQLMRVVLCEQLYRTFMINQHRPYHK
ncbi:methyltransferase RlmH ybeA [Fructilactobacillus florum 8D]|uniref:Ribosomal RNA large subunit methyltransferase H n=1 Tax=Fructilactobacillus florum 8D TaxID=1221538 RepID=W9EG66_9LACO|nr:23S rRNA (pseudouridine(1915)-N(3))-methyltransferase RlmH [Fructilactobacillus florum]ETO41057.1 methyltransferase RlmH ybeA [Fructilactobacillus florum 8D]